MTLFTAAYMKELFWDGRSASLEDQAHLPIIDPVEMAGDAAMIEARINAIPQYRAAFASAYGVDQARIGRSRARQPRPLHPDQTRCSRPAI